MSPGMPQTYNIAVGFFKIKHKWLHQYDFAIFLLFFFFIAILVKLLIFDAINTNLLNEIQNFIYFQRLHDVTVVALILAAVIHIYSNFTVDFQIQLIRVFCYILLAIVCTENLCTVNTNNNSKLTNKTKTKKISSLLTSQLRQAAYKKKKKNYTHRSLRFHFI